MSESAKIEINQSDRKTGLNNDNNELRFANGDVYTGDIVKGKMHGRGIL